MKKKPKYTRENPGPLRKPQLRILRALAQAARPLTSQELADAASVHVTMIGINCGKIDPAIRKKAEDDTGIISLHSRGLVEISENAPGGARAVYSLTTDGQRTARQPDAAVPPAPAVDSRRAGSTPEPAGKSNRFNHAPEQVEEEPPHASDDGRKKRPGHTRDNPGPLHQPQIRILRALAEAGRPLVRKDLSRAASVDRHMIGAYCGMIEPAVRMRSEDVTGTISLASRGLVEISEDAPGRAKAVYSLTARGRQVTAQLGTPIPAQSFPDSPSTGSSGQHRQQHSRSAAEPGGAESTVSPGSADRGNAAVQNDVQDEPAVLQDPQIRILRTLAIAGRPLNAEILAEATNVERHKISVWCGTTAGNSVKTSEAPSEAVPLVTRGLIEAWADGSGHAGVVYSLTARGWNTAKQFAPVVDSGESSPSPASFAGNRTRAAEQREDKDEHLRTRLEEPEPEIAAAERPEEVSTSAQSVAASGTEAEEESAQPREAETPGWIEHLLASPVFEDQKQMGGRSLPADEILTRLLSLLDQHGGKMTRAALARELQYPPVRLPGLLAKTQRILNVDGYDVLRRDEASDTVELDRELLFRQFGLIR